MNNNIDFFKVLPYNDKSHETRVQKRVYREQNENDVQLQGGKHT